MSHSHLRLAVVSVLLVVATSCGGNDHPTAPSVTNPPRAQAPAAPIATPGFPPVVKPARVFAFDHQLTYAVMDYTKGSRFVLYDDGTFALQYTRGFEYLGTYTTVNGVVTFAWQGTSTAGPWAANGSLQGDALSVTYNLIMSLSDFEDAVYQKTVS
jgi:hypothetical protein